MAEKFSVIVPVYNAENVLDECIKSLINQDYPKKDYEIIMVNDASTDGSKKIIQKYRQVKLIDFPKNQGRVVAREAGAKAARFGMIALTDSDCRASRDWLKEISKHDEKAMIGVTVNEKERSFSDRFFYLLREKYYNWPDKPVYLNKENYDRLPTGTDNLIIDKKIFLEFSPKEKGAFVSDDTLMIANIMKKHRILLLPKANVTHLERHGLKDLFVQWFRRGGRFWAYFIREKHNEWKITLCLIGLLIALLLGIPWMLLTVAHVLSGITAVFFGGVLGSIGLSKDFSKNKWLYLALIVGVVGISWMSVNILNALIGIPIFLLCVAFVSIYPSKELKDLVFYPLFAWICIAFLLGIIRSKKLLFAGYFAIIILSIAALIL